LAASPAESRAVLRAIGSPAAARSVTRTDDTERPATIRSAERGHDRVVRRLLAAGIDMDHVSGSAGQPCTRRRGYNGSIRPDFTPSWGVNPGRMLDRSHPFTARRSRRQRGYAQTLAQSSTSTSVQAAVAEALTHSSAACAPSPLGPNRTVGIPAAAMNAESAQ
jgi:hypothetical protein